MPDGRAFKDSVAFKQLLLADRDAVAKAFIEHLCTYALRRVLTFDDKEDVNAIVAEANKPLRLDTIKPWSMRIQ